MSDDDDDLGRTFYGKYRGTVTSNTDPEQRGRIQATVPDVTGELPSTWALPCAPVGGELMGFFAVPPIGAKVWIEYEGGDPDYPVWTGCFWGSSAEVPKGTGAVPGVSAITLQTQEQNLLSVSDAPGPTGGIVLQTASGVKISVNDTGITIDNGKGASIMIQGPSVSVNGTALVVT
jgi:uncharacterized protein involved in type VI secretion and phage assembly